MNKTVDTHICEVTVYDDQALVTRRGIVQLTGEERELIVAQLPTTLVSESVQVSGVGMTGGRLLGVRTERIETSEGVHPKVAQLTEEIRQLEEQKRYGQDMLTLLNLQRNFVKDLNNHYLDGWTKSANPEPLNIPKMGDLLDFVGERWCKLSTAIAQQDKDQKQLNNQLQALRSQLDQLSRPQSQETFNIIITLEPSEAAELELEVSYIVTQASWQPFYNLRWQRTSQKVNVSYLARVQQNTGEDWLGVALTLSTAQPKLGTQLPQLAPWYIDGKPSRDLGGRVKTTAESDKVPSRSASITMPFAGTVVESESLLDEELERLKAEMSKLDVAKQTGIVTFAVSNRCNIPSDGASHKTIIFNNDYPCRAEYITLPRRMNFAYLQATIANPLTSVTLLPGQASIFRDNTFIGTTQIQNIAPGQDFKINLGIDEGIKIERNLLDRQVEQKTIGNQRRTLATYAYQLLITNLHNHKADVMVVEQLPVSCHPQVKVRLSDCHPQIPTGEMGMLEWSLTLLPLSSQELSYNFTVEHPPELMIVGLDI
ncbi:MAG TPA: hypothetical protein DDZ80_24845 [Cyanobacteria bacterium UBA8803]|nr:hypothetical protein [Cyanobacteria bacterium UBA9273]HBL61532.1 hypothetical protein [Cyanobacteria bacterium UBA8803]